MAKKITTEVVIVGAGITGLAAAYYLSKMGIDFRIIEKSTRAGGVITTEKENGFVYETGPNTGVLSQPETAELIEELKGLCEIEIADAAAKKRWIWKGNAWQPLPSGFMAAVKTPLFTFRDKLGILAEPFRRKGKNPDETLDQLVLRRMGQSFLDYAVDPFILGIYSGDPSYLVTRYALPKLYNLEQKYGSFIGGAIRKGFEKKEPRAKLATGDVFSIKGGLQNLVDALTAKTGIENILLNFAEATVIPHIIEGYITKGQWAGEEVEINSRYVITTSGSHELPDLLPFVADEEMAELNNLLYAKVVQVTLGFIKWEGLSLDAFGGLVPFKENRDVLGILFLSSFLTGRAPGGGALLSVFMGGIRKPYLVDLTDKEILRILEKEVVAMTGLQSFNPDLIKITRYNHAIPQYGLSTGERLKAVESIQKSNPGLIIGGNLRNGIGMSDRIKQGRELAQSLPL
jgi:protoporphyrinogen/coproporphyrinogen III oxidase